MKFFGVTGRTGVKIPIFGKAKVIRSFRWHGLGDSRAEGADRSNDSATGDQSRNARPQQDPHDT